MPAAKTPQPKPSNKANFPSNKLIANLGSKSEQYLFRGNLRTAWGRD